MASTWRRVGFVLLLFVLFVSLAVPAGAHGNHLAADSQVTSDGTVRIEGTVLVTEGYVVLHRDDGGTFGDVLGHRQPDEYVYHGNLSVALAPSYWANVSTTATLWAVLHYDADNNGAFDASADPPIGGPDNPSQVVRLTVRKGDEPAYVLAETEHPQRTNESEVVVRRAALPADGYLVVRRDANGSPGAVVGQRQLGAGVHQDVAVSLDDHFYHHQPEQFTVWAGIHRGDGDDGFDEGDDPVSVNGSPVASTFQVERTGAIEAGHDHTPSTTDAIGEPTTAATTHRHDHDEASTPDPDTGATDEATPTPVSTSAVATQTDTERPTSTPGQPGPGVVVTLVAVLAMAVVAVRQSR